MGKLSNLSPLVPALGARLRGPQGQDEGPRLSARARGYTTEWDKASAAHRRDHPLCGYCAAGAFGPKRDRPASCTDHLYPHLTFPGVFWLRLYWVSCCHDCHVGPKQLAEQQGVGALDDLARLLGLQPL
jgi:hypothetical protein